MANDGIIQVTIDDGAFNAALLQFAQRVRNPQQLMARIGGFVREKMVLCFRDSQDPYGNMWLPLKYRRGKPLLDTGRLRNSISYRADANSVEIGTNVKYAAIQNFGGHTGARSQIHAFDKSGRFQSRARSLSRKTGSIRVAFSQSKGGNIPPRPFVPDQVRGLPPAWEAGILAEVRGFVTGIIE